MPETPVPDPLAPLRQALAARLELARHTGTDPGPGDRRLAETLAHMDYVAECVAGGGPPRGVTVKRLLDDLADSLAETHRLRAEVPRLRFALAHAETLLALAAETRDALEREALGARASADGLRRRVRELEGRG